MTPFSARGHILEIVLVVTLKVLACNSQARETADAFIEEDPPQTFLSKLMICWDWHGEVA